MDRGVATRTVISWLRQRARNSTYGETACDSAGDANRVRAGVCRGGKTCASSARTRTDQIARRSGAKPRAIDRDGAVSEFVPR